MAKSEIFSLSENEKLGKAIYDANGRYVESKDMTQELFEKLLRNSDLEFEGEYNEDAVARFSKVLEYEKNFFNENGDVFINKTPRYFVGFNHKHDYFELSFILKGNAIITKSDENILIREKTVIIFPIMCEHNIVPVKDSVIINIGIRKSTFNEAFHDLLSSGLPISTYLNSSMYEEKPYEIIVEDVVDEFIENIIYMIYDQQNNNNIEARKINTHLTQGLLYYIAENADLGSFSTSIYDKDILEIQNYIFENYKDITLEKLAERYHYSKAYLSRKFNKKIGIGFSELVQSIKLKRAANLIATGNQKISEVCEMVGYESESYFIQIFKEKYHCTPLQYRKKYQN